MLDFADVARGETGPEFAEQYGRGSRAASVSAAVAAIGER